MKPFTAGLEILRALGASGQIETRPYGWQSIKNRYRRIGASAHADAIAAGRAALLPMSQPLRVGASDPDEQDATEE